MVVEAVCYVSFGLNFRMFSASNAHVLRSSCTKVSLGKSECHRLDGIFGENVFGEMCCQTGEATTKKVDSFSIDAVALPLSQSQSRWSLLAMRSYPPIHPFLTLQKRRDPY